MNDYTAPGAQPAPEFPVRDYRVTTERRAEAAKARRSVMLVSGIFLALAVFAWVVFPPGEGTRLSLTYLTAVLAALSLLLLLRLWLIVRKANRFVSPEGSMLRLAPEGVYVTGDTFIPWQMVSGVWTHDTGPQLRASKGLAKRSMIRAGVNTANITIGIVDVAQISDPAGRVKRFATLPSGLTPGRLEFPFGTQFATPELTDAFAVFRWALPPEVPVRFATGVMDYAEAWAGTSDDVAKIREREAGKAPAQ